MKTKIFFIFFTLISGVKIFAQFPIPFKQIDSIFQKTLISDNDWAIGLSIEQAGIIPIIDSFGNVIDETPLGTFLLLKIGDNYFLQKICYNYIGDKFEPITFFGTRLKLSNQINLTYNPDSIRLAENEWVYPYIYKRDSLDIFYQQSPADHEPYYTMYFKTTKNDVSIRNFTETSLTEIYSFINSKNLNHNYNSKTFINRAFVTLVGLIKKNIKALAL